MAERLAAPRQSWRDVVLDAKDAPERAVLRELEFIGVSREYLSQMLFPTEIVTARKGDR